MNIKSTYNLISLATRIITIIGLCSVVTTKVSSLQANTLQEVYFKNTEYELNIYRISGTEPVPTILIIGGIHNEPG